MKKSNNNQITQGPIFKGMLVYFVTLLVGAFFQQFYNTVDAVIVGNVVGADGLAAVGGSAATIVNIFVGFFMGLSSGATVVIAQFFGAKQEKEVEKAVHTAMAIAIAGGIIITIVGFAITPNVISLMKTSERIKEPSIIYLRIFFLGMTANLVYNMGAGILRAVGDSKRPLIVLIISCFTNVGLDLFFVVVLKMGYMSVKMGVIGVAVATILCQLLSAVIVVTMLIRSNDIYKLVLHKIRFDRQMFTKIIRIGLPAGIQSTMYTFSNALIQTSINELGIDYTAAWAAYGKIDVVFWMAVNAIGTSVTTFAGQNFGAGKYDRVKKSTGYAFVIALLITIPLSTVMYFYSDILLRIFIKDSAEVISIGIQMVRFLVPFYVTYISVEIFSGVLRAMGSAFIPMIITLSGICALRVIWILTAFPIFKTVETVEASYPITWIVTSILFLIYYLYFTKKRIKNAA
ncbi:MATE family efflux transporter [Butyrivibrio sp. INlla21]|uniref:MATE family efflux transporter n=1 Tax=Butyrivibrio sp. INlla21 TaxID=1520811 RepID=UPI0008F25AB8|nr:MATE family efflux transporter [Butyrivibrio sp. INlla21]SFU53092.1 putative efflux protein, MATE family [Butyrivibrio sp. INlla21]